MSGVNEPAGIREGVKSNSKELTRLNFLNFKSNILKSMRAPIGSQFCNRLFFFVLHFSFSFGLKQVH